jgi:hypothetical protein
MSTEILSVNESHILSYDKGYSPVASTLSAKPKTTTIFFGELASAVSLQNPGTAQSGLSLTL